MAKTDDATKSPLSIEGLLAKIEEMQAQINAQSPPSLPPDPPRPNIRYKIMHALVAGVLMGAELHAKDFPPFTEFDRLIELGAIAAITELGEVSSLPDTAIQNSTPPSTMGPIDPNSLNKPTSVFGGPSGK